MRSWNDPVYCEVENSRGVCQGQEWLWTHRSSSFRSLKLLACTIRAHLHIWVPSRWVLVTRGRDKLTVTFTSHSWVPCCKSALLQVAFHQLKKISSGDPRILKVLAWLHKNMCISCLPKWDTIANLIKSAIRNDQVEVSSPQYRAANKFFIMIKVLIMIIAASNFIEFLIWLQILEFCFISFYFFFFLLSTLK